MIRFELEALVLSPAVARALLAFASKDETRAVLYGIGFNEGCVMATDGHAGLRFADAVIADGAESPWRRNGRLFPRAVVEKALEDSEAGAVRLLWSQLAPEHVKCPPLNQSEPKDGVTDQGLPIGFAGGLLARIELAAKACRRDRVPGELVAPDDPPAMLVALGDAYSPARYEIGGKHWDTAIHTAQVTIMPMRGGGDAKVISEARERIRERERKAEAAQFAREQRERDRADREKAKQAREEMKQIRKRDRDQRMPAKKATAAA